MRLSLAIRLAAVIFASCLLAYVAAAHDIPNDVTVQAFLRPEGSQLHCWFACR